MSDRVQDLTNHRKVAVACKNYIDKEIKASEDRILSIVARNNVDFIDHINEPTYRFTAPANAKLLMLQSIAGNSVKYAPTTASDSTTAYQKTIPSYSPSIDRASASMNILGGMSYKVNQLVANGNFESASDNKWVVSRGTLNISNNVATVTASDNSSPSFALSRVSMKESVVGHKYLVAFDIKHNIDTSKISQVEASGGWGTFVPTTPTINTKTRCIGITTGYSVASYLSIALRYNNASDMQIGVDKMEVENVQLIDLTAMGIDTSDVSVATSELLNRGIDINTYQAYDSGSIRDTAPTSVVSKDSNDTTIDTLSINASIQALDGYGWGINDTCYNYIDFNTKKFIKKVDKRAYQSGDEEDTSVLTDLTTTYYELETPVETDISQYLDGNEIEIEPNGTLSFESTYSAYVPSNVSYNGVIKHALATAVKQEGANLFDNENTPLVNSTFSASNQTLFSYGGFDLKVFNLTIGQTYTITSTKTMFLGETNNLTNSGTVSTGTSYTFIATTNYLLITNQTPNEYTDMFANIMINYGSTALSYKPYKAPITRLLPNSEAKYSWGIADGVRNTRVFCDDEGNAVNEGELSVNNQDMGDLSYTYNSLYNVFVCSNYPNRKFTNQYGIDTCICLKYDNNQLENWNWVDKTIGVGTSFSSASNPTIIIKDTAFNDATIFKSAMSGVPLFYEKNATDTETLDDFDYFFDCEEGDTFTIIGCELLQCYATYSFLIKEAKSNE